LPTYIGRHNQPDPAKTRKSNDGRDRTKAEVVDTYNAADKNKAEPKSNSRSTNTDCRIWTIREMKSEKTRHQTRINEFWSWFCDVAEALAGNVENPTLLKDFDGRVRDLDPKLS